MPADATTNKPATSGSHAAGNMIMALFLASLAMGLGAVVVFYFVTRAQAETWPPPNTPALPAGLWLSTSLLLLSSGTMHFAHRAARRGDRRGLRIGSLLTLTLAMAFVASQLVNWGLAVAAELPPSLNMYATTFYLFTGFHGAHVIGGLFPLVIVNVQATRGRYTPHEHAGLTWCAWYWHFVDAVWLIMFATLKLTS